MRKLSPEINKKTSLNTLSLSRKNSPRSLSMTKYSPKKQQKMQFLDPEQVINRMKKNRLKICDSLDTYVLLISSNSPIRCLQHNSNISLYCETQQRLLCSNCIFSTLNHKLHKVLPVEKSLNKISKDVQSMRIQVEREVKGFESDYQKFLNHYHQEQSYAEDFIRQLQVFYQKARVLLSECEMRSKKRLLTAFQNQQTNYQTLLVQLGWLKDIYREQNKKSYNFKDDNILLYDHMMLYTLVNRAKYSNKYWNIKTHQMQKLGNQEIKKAGFVVQVIQKLLGEHFIKK